MALSAPLWPGMPWTQSFADARRGATNCFPQCIQTGILGSCAAEMSAKNAQCGFTQCEAFNQWPFPWTSSTCVGITVWFHNRGVSSDWFLCLGLTLCSMTMRATFHRSTCVGNGVCVMRVCAGVCTFVYACMYTSVCVHKRLYEFVWACMSLHELVWVCMSLYELVWVCMSLYELVWVCMSLYELVWVCMSLYEFVWACISLYELACKTLSNLIKKWPN
jgi:hypothetical protein